jgi:hypothetical protein
VVNSVENSKNRAIAKEGIQAVSQIIQAGYMNGDFAGITDWTVDSPTDPIVVYFTERLGAITKQCLKDEVTASCNIRHGDWAATDPINNHAARWVFSNGSNLGFNTGSVAGQTLAMQITYKPDLINGGGQQIAIVCNISDTTQTSNGAGFLGFNTSYTFKPAQCGPWWSVNQSPLYYPITWEALFS